MISLEYLAACLGLATAAAIVLVAWMAGARCPHCGRTRVASAASPGLQRPAWRA